ncbi:uncharacterized protein CEXT_779511 [Caerostris extrusa]|uniref:Uncharacterized protein n=1 Tax=Caerostris extrusa TaxID=172846 RepID=A0AAV4XZT2_CAEEX|nr:uncharacterized protein CEXT_779511 [Caerostris extrusa]
MNKDGESKVPKEGFRMLREINFKKESKAPSAIRHLQRRLAITPNDTKMDEESIARICQKFFPQKSADKGQDGLHMAKKSKKARMRARMRKKLNGAFGNMNSLKDALPVEEQPNEECHKEKPRVSKSFKTQNKKRCKFCVFLSLLQSISHVFLIRFKTVFYFMCVYRLSDINWYRSAIQDPLFKADPFGAITENIRSRFANEQQDEI